MKGLSVQKDRNGTVVQVLKSRGQKHKNAKGFLIVEASRSLWNFDFFSFMQKKIKKDLRVKESPLGVFEKEHLYGEAKNKKNII